MLKPGGFICKVRRRQNVHELYPCTVYNVEEDLNIRHVEVRVRTRRTFYDFTLNNKLQLFCDNFILEVMSLSLLPTHKMATQDLLLKQVN